MNQNALNPLDAANEQQCDDIAATHPQHIGNSIAV